LNYDFSRSLKRCKLFATRRTSAEVRFDIDRVVGIKLVVQQRVNEDFCLGAIHGAACSPILRRARTSDLAAASRDNSVSVDTPKTFVISR